MRIHHDDCDVPKPSSEDIFNELGAIPKRARDKFVPAESNLLAKMWIDLVKICATLGKILRIHYCVAGAKPTIEEIDASAEELRACRPHKAFNDNSSDLLLLHIYHVELFYE
jgi:hypothetical protein